MGSMAQAAITLPAGATLSFEEVDGGARYALPVGPHNGDTLPTILTEGEVTRRAWRLGGTGLTSFQILVDLRAQLVEDGYEIIFECDQKTCGGYGFRFATEVIGEPEMHVDFGDFQFLSARVPGDSGQFASLLVSRSASAAFIQMITVGPSDIATPDPGAVTAPTAADPGPAPVPDEATGDLGAAMSTIGRFILADLTFDTGSAALGPDRFDTLAALAAYLNDAPSARVALVGHTDAEGSLTANIAISQERAISVMDRLVSDHGVDPAQLEAKGIGYLAPIASNQTEEGRTRNRRVEAILVTE